MTADAASGDPRPVLVTGAGGFIGSAVMRQLATTGRRVRGLVRTTPRASRMTGFEAEWVPGDIRVPEAANRATAGCGAVVHLAGISGWSHVTSPDLDAVIVDGTRNVIEAARTAGVTRVVYVSSAVTAGASRRPDLRDESGTLSPADVRRLPYARAKQAAEALCAAAVRDGLDVVVVNPAEVYGPGDDDLVSAGNLVGLLAGPLMTVCDGGTSVVHVADVADGIVRALDRGRRGERYLLGSENLHHRELGRLLLDLAGRRGPVVSVPAAVAELAGSVAFALRLPFPVTAGVLPYATRFWFLDCTKARRELGWRPRPARDVLAETIGWLQSGGRLRRPL